MANTLKTREKVPNRKKFWRTKFFGGKNLWWKKILHQLDILAVLFTERNFMDFFFFPRINLRRTKLFGGRNFRQQAIFSALLSTGILSDIPCHVNERGKVPFYHLYCVHICEIRCMKDYVLFSFPICVCSL